MQRQSLLFPLLAVLVSIAAYNGPQFFVPFQSAIVPALMVIMFAMGLTLTRNDFRRVALRPKAIGLGVLLQFSVMPTAAFVIGHALSLTSELTAGLVLVGCSPGGTASNVMAYLSRADVALSVTMTMISTLLAVFLTPFLTWFLVGRYVPLDVAGILLSMVQIVLVPVLLGATINTLFGHRLERYKGLLPILATTVILFIIAIVVALNQDKMAVAGIAIFLAVILHNTAGLLAGFWLPRLMGFDTATCRAIALEVGMQNSGLSVALALNHVSALAALPGAIFSVWHNVTGAILAGHWGARAPDEGEKKRGTN